MTSFSNFHLFAICVLIWGSTWLAITFQLGTVAPEISVGYRFVLASAALFAYCGWRGLKLRFTLREHVDLLLFGASMFCISYIFVYYAETYIVSGMVAVAYSASPMLNMLMARALFSTPMTTRVVVGALFGIAGIVCVFWHAFANISASRNAELGAILTVLSVVASSAGSMFAMRIQKSGYSTWSSMAWGMLYGGGLALAIGLILGKPLALEVTGSYIGSLVYLAIFGSVITFACYLTLLARIGAARAAYVGVMVPIVALGVSFFFEKFAWGWLTTLGVVLSVAGNIVILRGRQKDQPAS
ncbi:MAG: EamA family transporter [Burkholderiales bacterium]|nr:EamA family transporter [Burkholderiales bacterium]